MCCEKAKSFGGPEFRDVRLIKFGCDYAGKTPDFVLDTAEIDIKWANFNFIFGVYEVLGSVGNTKTLRLFGLTRKVGSMDEELFEFAGKNLPPLLEDASRDTHPRGCLVQDKGMAKFGCEEHDNRTSEIFTCGYSAALLEQKKDGGKNDLVDDQSPRDPKTMVGLIMKGNNRYQKYGY